MTTPEVIISCALGFLGGLAAARWIRGDIRRIFVASPRTSKDSPRDRS